MLLSLCLYHRQSLCVNRHRHHFSLQLTFYRLQDWFFLSLLFFPSLPAGLYQSVLQEHLALRLPHQHRGRPELPGRLLFGPVPVCWGPQTQQEAAAQLPVSPVLQQRPLHQRLPAGERCGRRRTSVASSLSSGSWTVFLKRQCDGCVRFSPLGEIITAIPPSSFFTDLVGVCVSSQQNVGPVRKQMSGWGWAVKSTLFSCFCLFFSFLFCRIVYPFWTPRLVTWGFKSFLAIPDGAVPDLAVGFVSPVHLLKEEKNGFVIPQNLCLLHLKWIIYNLYSLPSREAIARGILTMQKSTSEARHHSALSLDAL